MKTNKKNKYLEIIIAILFIIVLVYVSSVTVRITSGVTKTVEPSANTVRLQVLNGCGERGLAALFADKLTGYKDEELEIKVVDTDNFDETKIARSFVISRLEDRQAAEVFAGKIGLDPSQVIYRELENNYRHVSATLVLGEDYDMIKLAGKTLKEK
ncbi:MAG: LytR C-terminal domain-containing protein [Candidatus Zixiibacteriota bacterium]